MSHLSAEDLVAYFAGDHPDETAVEEHLFGCGACTREAARVAGVTETIRDMVSPVVRRSTVDRLRAKGKRVMDNRVARGSRGDVIFPRDVDFLIHHLEGLDLTTATRVDVRVSAESSGQEITHLDDVPFDRDAGAVFIACQRHFEAFPPDTVIDVTVHSTHGDVRERYPILHLWA